MSGYRMGKKEINVVCYADDVVLIEDIPAALTVKRFEMAEYKKDEIFDGK